VWMTALKISFSWRPLYSSPASIGHQHSEDWSGSGFPSNATLV
jgi:hypothetical protein